MQQTRAVEVGTGLFVLLGMGALFFLTTQTTGGDDFKAEETFASRSAFREYRQPANSRACCNVRRNDRARNRDQV